jgi:N-acetylmuramoyl-L-alanine amidase
LAVRLYIITILFTSSLVFAAPFGSDIKPAKRPAIKVSKHKLSNEKISDAKLEGAYFDHVKAYKKPVRYIEVVEPTKKEVAVKKIKPEEIPEKLVYVPVKGDEVLEDKEEAPSSRPVYQEIEVVEQQKPEPKPEPKPTKIIKSPKTITREYINPVYDNSVPPSQRSNLAATEFERFSDGSDSGRKVIVIDAGHGGVDPGALSKNGDREKNLTLKYALALKETLSSSKYKIVLTRSSDKFVSLADRVKIAKKNEADLFISLHIDSHPNPYARGLSVYTLSERRADYEKAKQIKSGDIEIAGSRIDDDLSDEVKHSIIDMVQDSTSGASNLFAKILIKELGPDVQLQRNTHRSAGFMVLTSSDISSVLVELGYISNKQDLENLQTSDYRNEICGNIAKAVDKYFRQIR